MQVFSRNCTRILLKTQGKKIEDMFLVKIARKGTSLKSPRIWAMIAYNDSLDMEMGLFPGLFTNFQV